MPSPPSRCALASKASCRRSSPRTRFTTRASWLGRWVRAEGCSYACRAGATRTWIQSMVAETAPRLEAAVRATGDLKLIDSMMAGPPTKKKSTVVGKRLATSGIAALEIGIPFSDPLADGPVIQKAGQTALEHGMTVGASLELAAAVAREGIPIVLMTYINPVLSHDPRRFAAEAPQAAVIGATVPRTPPAELEPV